MTHTITLGGRTFAVTPPGPREFAEMAALLSAPAGRPISPDRVREALRTLEGGRVSVYVLLKAADPTVTPEWVAEQIPDVGTVHDVYAALRPHLETRATP